MAVFAHHLLATFARRPHAIFLMSQGGVLIFFVHTSLVLMMSMERLKLAGFRLFAVFYTRRFFRLYPLSTLCILTVVVFQIPSASWLPYQSVSLPALGANLALVTNLTHSPLVSAPLWSLPYEIQMYLVLPVFFLLVRRVSSSVAAVALWIAIMWSVGHVPGRAVLFTLFGPGIPWFMAGILAYKLRKGVNRPFLPSWVWPLGFLLLLAAYSLSNDDGTANQRSPFCALGVALLFPFCRELTLSWLRAVAHAVAKYSYGIYLSHLPILWLAFYRLRELPAAARWLTFIALAAAVPVLLYRFLEKPMIDFGSALAKRKIAQRPSAVAAAAGS